MSQADVQELKIFWPDSASILGGLWLKFIVNNHFAFVYMIRLLGRQSMHVSIPAGVKV